MSVQTLADYVAIMRRVGPERFAQQYDCPIFVGEKTLGESKQGFHTVFADRTTLRPDEAYDQERVTREQLLEAAVFLIRKRPGGPFSKQIGIGRAKNTDVYIPSPHISKYHAFLTRSVDGGYAITDAGSANGTRVDEQPIGEEHELLDGSVVMLGPYALQFLLPSSFWDVIRRLR